jgi:2'-5' RNA ligase
MIRLFVAIEVPDELRRRIAAICQGVERARWVPEENIHLTLRFIGEVPEDVMEDIVAELGAVGGDPFEVTLVGAGHFESGRRVRSLWLGVERNAALQALRERIDAAILRAGLPPEGRKFKPHITLARLNDGSPEDVRGWLQANTLFRSVPFTVGQFVLFSSFQGRNGSIYRSEAEFPLGPVDLWAEEDGLDRLG